MSKNAQFILLQPVSRPQLIALYFRLFRHLKRVVYLDA
jgi:hypothetical protein